MPTPSFTPAELYEIHDTAMVILRRYLDSYDALDHERQHGTLGTLLSIVRKTTGYITAGDDGAGAASAPPAWLARLEGAVASLQEALSRAPVAVPAKIAAAHQALAAYGIALPAHNSQRYTWDLWELRALASGVSPELARLGRDVLRCAHFQATGTSATTDEGGMLRLALNAPDAATVSWSQLIDGAAPAAPRSLH